MSAKSTTPAATTQEIAQHGWTAIAVDSEAIFNGKDYLHKPEPVTMDSMPFPHDDPIVHKIYQHVKAKLPTLVFNHSMRVYHFSIVILRHQFPEFAEDLSRSTIALAALLHDIGTVDEFIESTLLSFEWWGGYYSLRLLEQHGASSQQAEAVAEAIIRHQDIGSEGTITFLGQLLQLSTIYDNMGLRPQLVDHATRSAIVAAFPRTTAGIDGRQETWSGCFAATIRKENGLKPWAHTTHLGETAFPEGVLANGKQGLMSEFENELSNSNGSDKEGDLGSNVELSKGRIPDSSQLDSFLQALSMLSIAKPVIPPDVDRSYWCLSARGCSPCVRV
ncbi:hypothetical protein Micbo1qcDRAFT_193054 [Microdochium bolleyi]|uniref:HD/PDEase domain-containing protein n=1 Tax=Microdochium bolleyi TaxID=196109 RepID=A0A136J907_9PEZI|nr:hypothetical protein Micbo1qcDRAFT_193054 [Microdochium bolleyi]